MIIEILWSNMSLMIWYLHSISLSLCFYIFISISFHYFFFLSCSCQTLTTHFQTSNNDSVMHGYFNIVLISICVCMYMCECVVCGWRFMFVCMYFFLNFASCTLKQSFCQFVIVLYFPYRFYSRRFCLYIFHDNKKKRKWFRKKNLLLTSNVIRIVWCNFFP